MTFVLALKWLQYFCPSALSDHHSPAVSVSKNDHANQQIQYTTRNAVQTTSLSFFMQQEKKLQGFLANIDREKSK